MIKRLSAAPLPALALAAGLGGFSGAAAAHTKCASLTAPAEGGEATALLQTAIDRCSRQGGGRLTLNPGLFITGPLHLASGVDLHLSAGAVLRGVRDQARYRNAVITTPFQPGEALISADHVHDIAVTGPGTLDGSGDLWWPDAEADRQSGSPKTIAAGLPATNGLPRPWLIEFHQTTRARIDGPTLINSPMWGLVLRYADDTAIHHVTITNPEPAPNTDGIDIVASRRVTITDSRISTGDDCIAIKSGLAGGPLATAPTQDITIRKMAFGQGHGLSIGSETRFGVRNVVVDDVSFNGTDNGIRIKSGRDRGNLLENFQFRHITMTGVKTALSIMAYYPKLADENDPPQPITATTPQIRHVVIEDLSAEQVETAGLLVGLPEAPLTDIQLTRVKISAQKPLLIRHATVHLNQVAITGPAEPIRQQRSAVVSGQ